MAKAYIYDESTDSLDELKVGGGGLVDTSDLELAIQNAQTTANGAATAATAAQNTANAANTSAGQAQTTANEAKTAAANAQTTANEAKTAANEAKTAASNAQTSAASALAKAEEALANGGGGGATEMTLSANLTLTADSPRTIAVSATQPGLKIIMPPVADLEADGQGFIIANTGDYGITVVTSTGAFLGNDSGVLADGEARGYVLVNKNEESWVVLGLEYGGGANIGKSGFSLRAGVTHIIKNSAPNNAKTVKISNDKCVLFFHNAGAAECCVVSVSGDTISTHQVTELPVYSAGQYFSATSSIDERLFYVSFDSGGRYACELIVNEDNTITINRTHSLSFEYAADYAAFDIKCISNDTLAIFAKTSSTLGYKALTIVKFEQDGTSKESSIAVGTVKKPAVSHKIVVTDSNEYYLLYNHSGDTGIHVSQFYIDSTGEVSLGDEIFIDLGQTLNAEFAVSTLDGSRCCVAYVSGNDAHICVLEFKNNSASFIKKSPVESGTNTTTKVEMTKLTDTKLFICMVCRYTKDSTAHTGLFAIIVNISHDNIISSGDLIQLVDNGTTSISSYGYTTCALNANSAIVTYRQSTSQFVAFVATRS